MTGDGDGGDAVVGHDADGEDVCDGGCDDADVG